MKRLCLIIIATLLLTACRSAKLSVSTEPVILNNADSVRVEKIVETVYVPVEVPVPVPVQSDKNAVRSDSSHVETDVAFSDAWVANGILFHLIRNKPVELTGSALVPQTNTSTSAEAVKVREVPVPKPYPVEVERQFTLMEQIKLAAFWYLVGSLGLCIVYIFLRKRLRSMIKAI